MYAVLNEHNHNDNLVVIICMLNIFGSMCLDQSDNAPL